MNKTYFTVGPSQLYPTVKKHIRSAVKHDIGSISHRGSQFKEIYQSCVGQLKELIAIPQGYHVFFISSGTEAMERVIQNCVEKTSLHFANGSFGKRFYETAADLGKKPILYEVPDGTPFDFGQLANTCYSGKRGTSASKIQENGFLDQAEESPWTSLQTESHFHSEDESSSERAVRGQDDKFKRVELFAFTHNDTSTGFVVNMEDVYQLKRNYPKILVSLDIVSSVPYVQLEWKYLDCVFFSVQKLFGLPAGLGVIIISPAALEKAVRLKRKRISIGSYHSFPTLLKSADKFETPETPNVLGIYLFSKVLEDFLSIGIERIREETEEKAALVYNFLSYSNKYSPFVKEPIYQSKTTIVVEVKAGSRPLIGKLKSEGMVVGSGYGTYKEQHIRIANFPALHKKQVKQLLKTLSS